MAAAAPTRRKYRAKPEFYFQTEEAPVQEESTGRKRKKTDPRKSPHSFGVSGGGVRATLVGLVALEELNAVLKEQDAEVHPCITYGLSGGAWSVLLHELDYLHRSDASYKPAFQRAKEFVGAPVPGSERSIGQKVSSLFTDEPLQEIGTSFSFTAHWMFKSVWEIYDKWKEYVHKSVVRAFTPLAKDDDEAAALISQAKDCNILVGMSMCRSDERVVVLTGSDGKVHDAAAANPLESLECEPRDHKSIWEEEMHKLEACGYPDPSKIGFRHLDRHHQLVCTSTAFLYIRSTHLIKDLYRSAVKVALEFPSGLQDCSLWDLGLRCNIPVTPQQLVTKGVSLIIDASDDKKIFQSMNDAIAWWYARYGVLVTISSLDDLEDWNGVPIRLSALNPHHRHSLRRYVRLYKTGHGRQIVVIQLGRIPPDNKTPKVNPAAEEEPSADTSEVKIKEARRLNGLTTTAGLAHLRGVRTFGRKEVGIIDLEVRAFFKRIFQILFREKPEGDTSAEENSKVVRPQQPQQQQRRQQRQEQLPPPQPQQQSGSSATMV